MTAAQAATLAKKSKAGKLILVHLSQRYENKEKIVEKEAKKVFKNTTIAEDLTSLELK